MEEFKAKRHAVKRMTRKGLDVYKRQQHQFLFLTKRPDLLDFDTDLENAWFGVTVTRKAEL